MTIWRTTLPVAVCLLTLSLGRGAPAADEPCPVRNEAAP